MPKHRHFSALTMLLLSASVGSAMGSEMQQGSVEKQAAGSGADLSASQTGKSGALNASTKQDALNGSAAQTTLQGSVNQAGVDPLQGTVNKQSLDGGADLNALNAAKSGQTPLKGFVDKQAVDGAVDLNALDGAKTGNVLDGSTQKQGKKLLQGGVNDDASLNSSVKVNPATNPRIPSLIHIDPSWVPSKINQYSGVTQYAPMPNPNTLSGGVGRAAHIIPPISTTTPITPRNGVVNWASGFSSFSTTSTYTIKVPGQEVSATTTRSGVSSYVPGFEVTNITNKSVPSREITNIVTHSGVTTFGGGHGTMPAPASAASWFTMNGVTAYAPGYEVTNVTKLREPGRESAISTKSGVSSYAPGYQVSICTARSGVVCWDAGYEVSMLAPGMAKSTLGGVWFSPTNVAPPQGLRANQGKLFTNELFGKPLPGAQLQATGQLLPQFRHSPSDAKLTWDEWYKRIGRAIYDSWQNADVCPGDAKVAITITKNRDLSCQVAEFYPAADIERNGAKEQAFKEAAIKAVQMINKYEIPEFPSGSDLEKVSFSVDMQRTVNGSSGFHVASAH